MNRQTLTHNHTPGPVGAKTELKAKLYPNGECVVYKAKGYKPEPLPQEKEPDPWALGPFLVALYGSVPPEALRALVALGLSPHSNFDSLIERALKAGQYPPPAKLRYGANGITSYGARRVRNACYLLESAVPKKFTVFATCTVPALPLEDMARIHERWNDVVEVYRRKLRRRLQKKGLSGDSVTVTEIQTKRYERTGLPVLHIHSVFVGRCANGKPAVSTKAHDEMWREALASAIGHCVLDLRSACNLQWVKKSAEGYLGKYMTKGSKAVRKVVESGFGGWLPKQWWNMAVSLGKRIDQQTRCIDEMAEWLNGCADGESKDVWEWHRDVRIEMFNGDFITIARYGRLSIRQTAQIKAAYPTPNRVDDSHLMKAKNYYECIDKD